MQNSSIKKQFLYNYVKITHILHVYTLLLSLIWSGHFYNSPVTKRLVNYILGYTKMRT